MCEGKIEIGRKLVSGKRKEWHQFPVSEIQDREHGKMKGRGVQKKAGPESSAKWDHNHPLE